MEKLQSEYISYLKESSDINIEMIVRSFLDSKITFEDLINQINPVLHDRVKYHVFCKSKKIDDLFK